MAGTNNFIAIGSSAFEVDIIPLSKADPAPFPVVLFSALPFREIAAALNCFERGCEP